MATAKQVIEYIEELTLCQGRFAGDPFLLHNWQKRFIRGMMRVEGDAALTVGRGAGKSTLCAGLALAYLNGPAAQPNSEILCVASAFDQAKIIFGFVLAFLGEQVNDRKLWRLQDSTNRSILTNKQNGVVLRAIGSDPKRAHGRFPAIIFCDELAQWQESVIAPMLASLRTSAGKIPGSRLVFLGTRADSPDHDFERILNGSAEYSQSHAARKDDPPFRRTTWKRANPGLDLLPDIEKAIRREAERAKKDPAELQSFRALRLNQGVSDSLESVLCSAENWRDAETEEDMREGDYILAIDPGQNASLTGVSAYWWASGYCESFAGLPHQPDLHTRGIRDGVGGLYAICAERGEIYLAGDRVTELPSVLEHAVALWGEPVELVCDRWRLEEMRQSMDSVGLRCPLVERGQGYKDQGEDCRIFMNALLDGNLKPQKSLLVRASVGGARTMKDPTGAAKLRKRGGAHFRDDVACAIIMACAEGQRRAKREARRKPFSYVIVPPPS